MFVEHDFYVGFEELISNNKISNKGILRFLEDIAGIHSDMVGHGLNDIPKTKHSWILLGWRVKIFKRPSYGETITVKTWSKSIHKFYAFRDFEIYGSNKDLIGIATSKWIYINVENGAIEKVPDNVIDVYKSENISVFEDESFKKIEITENSDIITNYKVYRSMIDMNEHVHNLYYLDIANEALPENIYSSKEFNEFEIMYKKEIKQDDNIKCFYTVKDKDHTVIIKSKDETNIHAVIILKE